MSDIFTICAPQSPDGSEDAINNWICKSNWWLTGIIYNMKKGNNFVPPQVATPQQYFMMNLATSGSIANHTQPAQLPPNNNNYAPPNSQPAFSPVLK